MRSQSQKNLLNSNNSYHTINNKSNAAIIKVVGGNNYFIDHYNTHHNQMNSTENNSSLYNANSKSNCNIGIANSVQDNFKSMQRFIGSLKFIIRKAFMKNADKWYFPKLKVNYFHKKLVLFTITLAILFKKNQ